MRYLGRTIEPISFWSQYVDFPAGMDTEGPFLPLVHCPNPDHDNTRSPAFQINVDQPLVHCFSGCGISGHYAHAISVIEGIDLRKAKRQLVKHARVPSAIQRPVLKSKPKPVTLDDSILRDFSYLPPVAVEYLESRKISADSIARWRIGWNSRTKRIVIPLRDERGILRGTAERGISAKSYPKYLYSPGFDRNSCLFGGCYLDLGMVESSGIILVEGSLDTIRLHQHGLQNAIGLLGGHLTKNQASKLHRIGGVRVPCLYLMLDRDKAGLDGFKSVIKWMPSMPTFVCRYPKMKTDPAELTEAEARRSIDRAVHIGKFNQQAELNLFEPLRREKLKRG